MKLCGVSRRVKWFWVAMIGAAAMLLAGCGVDAKTEARLRHVEERQENLRQDLIAMNKTLDHLSKSITDLVATNTADLGTLTSNSVRFVELMVSMQDEVEALRATNTMLLSRAAGARTMSAMPAAPRPVYQGTRDGVPISIYNQIAGNAAQKWVGNYEMQKYEIDQQVQAYRQLNP